MSSYHIQISIPTTLDLMGVTSATRHSFSNKIAAFGYGEPIKTPFAKPSIISNSIDKHTQQ